MWRETVSPETFQKGPRRREFRRVRDSDQGLQQPAPEVRNDESFRTGHRERDGSHAGSDDFLTSSEGNEDGSKEPVYNFGRHRSGTDPCHNHLVQTKVEVCPSGLEPRPSGLDVRTPGGWNLSYGGWNLTHGHWNLVRRDWTSVRRETSWSTPTPPPTPPVSVSPEPLPTRNNPTHIPPPKGRSPGPLTPYVRTHPVHFVLPVHPCPVY